MSEKDKLTVILKDNETTELTFRVYPSGQPNHPQAKSATLKLVRILKGFWLNENNEELTQENGLNNNVFFGQKVKIKLVTSHTNDGQIIQVEIKLKQGDKYIKLEESEKEKLKIELKVKNNEAISEPLYLDPKWYAEKLENYNYNTHQTEIDSNELVTFVFDAKYEKQETKHGRIDLPKESKKKLKPISYRRNYEELIGLFKTDNSGKKDNIDNYENKFIKLNFGIKSIVDEFIKDVIKQDITISEIKILVEEKATDLWHSAVKQVQNGNLDDRPLYWARNKMQTWLKRNPLFKDQINFEKSIVKKGTELEEIITLFEEKSRNYKSIDFSKAPAGSKKVLITGFDPFLLNSIDHPYKNYYNILQSNPSGVVALSLNNNNGLGALIQTMMFPVRYLDFDSSNNPTKGIGEGVVEKYIKPLISEVDAIITISQALPNEYNIDVFGTLTRGGGYENLNYTRENLSKAITTDLEWIKTTLNSGFTDIKEVKYEWIYDGKDGKINPPKDGVKINEGSGSNYLSNEIFYRVGKMRTTLRPKLETGHFHISKIQDERIGEDLNPLEIKEVLGVVKKSLNKGIKKLK